MGWTFVWLMVALKIPIAGLFYIVWWAIKSTDEEPVSGGDGDGGVRPPQRPHRRGPNPRRRGPHGAAAMHQPAPRTRPVVHARAAPAGRHARKI